MLFQRRTTVAALLTAFLGALPLAQNQPAPNDRQARISDLLAAKNYETAIPLLRESLAENRLRQNWNALGNDALKLAGTTTSTALADSICRFLSENLRLLEANGFADSTVVARMYSFRAVNQMRADRMPDALVDYQQAISIFEKNGTLGGQPAYACKNAAQIFLRYDDFTNAISYLETAIRVDTGSIFEAANQAQLANCYRFLNDTARAFRHFQAGMAAKNKSPVNTANLEANAAFIFSAKGDFQTAAAMLNRSLAWFSDDENWAGNRLRCLTELADMAEKQHNLIGAEKYYHLAEEQGKAHFSKKTREMARFWHDFAHFLLRQNRRAEALAACQQALVHAFPAFENAEVQALPEPDQSLVESYCQYSACLKGRILLATDSPSLADRQLAARCFELAFASSVSLRKTWNSDFDKLQQSENNLAWYRQAALNLAELARFDTGKGQFERLFSWCERTRALALRDRLEQNRAILLAEIPDSLLQKEERFRRLIADLELKKRELSADDQPAQTLAADQLFKSKRAHERLLEKLETDFSQFQALTRKPFEPDFEALKNALSDSSAILEFWNAGSLFFQFCLQKEGISLNIIPADSLFTVRVPRFLTRLADRNSQAGNPDSFFEESHFLFKKLWPASLPASVKNVWLIPDGLLCYLPFEALLTGPHTGKFGDAPWLFRQKSIRYGWALDKPLPENRVRKNRLLQIAPFVSSSRNGLPILPNSLAECPEMGWIKQLSSAGTADYFLQNCAESHLIHLSTHAEAGQNKAEPIIEFADRPLTMTELYALRMHADLVCLSACETGIGQFANGEGTLSLARAFSYAGAASLVASLWKVNEQSTARLFSHFYEKLAAGLPRSEALRQAKLDFLKSDGLDARKSPFYWAGFVLIGEDGLLKSGGSAWPWPVWGLIFGVVLGLIWAFFKRKIVHRRS